MVIRKALLSVLAMLLIAGHADAQIRLTVTDEMGLPLPYVNAILVDQAGGFAQTGTAGNESGLVYFGGLETGRYDLLLLYLGYETDTLRDIFVDAFHPDTVDLGVHALSPKSTLLGVVDIVGQAPVIVRQSDGLIYNIEKTTMAAGESALSLLNHVPGVMVSGGSDIMVNGKRDVLVLLDGRQQYVSGGELAALLQSIPSESIKQIVVRNSASARYDAGAGSSVLDIVLKRSTYSGIKGSVWARYRQGQYGSANTGANLNWKYRKFSGNLYYFFNYYQGYHDIDMDRQVDGLGPGGEPLYFKGRIDENWTHVSHAPRMRLYYDVAEGHRFGLEADLLYYTVDFPNENSTAISDDGGEPDSMVFATIQNDERKLFPSVNFSYRAEFAEGNGLVDLTYDFFHYDYSKESTFRNQAADANAQPVGPPRVFREINPLLNPVHTAAFDFSRAMLRDHYIDLGAKVTFIDKMSDTRFENLAGDGFAEDPLRTRSNEYREHIYAAYLNWGKDFIENWSLETGLRVEHTRISQVTVNPDESLSRTYWDVFPYFRLFRKTGNDHTISMSYARKLLRPTFNQLNPFVLDLNPFLVSSGNPDLQPQINNVADLEFTFKGKYSLYASYIFAEKSINSVFLEEAAGVYNLTYMNFEPSHFASLGFSIETGVNKWWNLSVSANGAYDVYNATIGGTAIKRQGASVTATVNNQFSLPAQFYIDLFGTVESPRYTSIERYKTTGRVDVSLTKFFLNKTLSIKLKGRDLFYTEKFESSLDYLNLHMDYLERGDSRRLELSVTYNFQAGENFRSRGGRNSNTEEKQRAN